MAGDDLAEHLPLPHLPLHILLALAEGERHGWGIVKRMEELGPDHPSPSSGSLYLAITRLEERGLIESAPPPPDETDARRRYYRLAPLGRRVLEADVRRLTDLVAAAHAAGLGAR